MKEKDITPIVLRSMRDDARFGSCAVEIKICKGKTLSWTALKEHQRRALELAGNRMYYKIPDDSIGQKPFDAFILKKSEAYLVIYFAIKHNECWAIPIEKVPTGSIGIDCARENGIKVIL